MTSLAPALLLSMPQLRDPFSRSVILLCKHSREDAFGLIVNRPFATTGRVVVNLGPALGARDERNETISTDRELEVWIGGPVQPQRSWILVRGDPDEDDTSGVRITENLYLSTSPVLLRRLLAPEPPSNARLMIGYSGWGAGQLDAELEASAWLMSDVDTDFIFTTPPDRMWEAAIRRLGADPAALQMSRGVH